MTEYTNMVIAHASVVAASLIVLGLTLWLIFRFLPFAVNPFE
jgi:hypothetical protein